MRTTPEDLLRAVDDAKAVRRQERAFENRPFDPWERYRALTDQYDRLTDAAEQGDRKTRFALLILGGINALNLLIVAQGALPTRSLLIASPAAVYVACYALLSLGFFVYAIGALRPRESTASLGGDGRDRKRPLLQLDAEDLEEPASAYAARWQDARIGDMNLEVAAMIHGLSRQNAEKLEALRRVYGGLYVLVALTAIALVSIGVADFGAR
jgi:hypothetical protein